jgi:multiple sugar transport system permease protein
MPPVAATILWLWILNPQIGVVSAVFSLFHANSPGWFTDPNWAKPALILLGLWQIGTTTVIYLAGLQGVPRELYEAAALDGAGFWSKTRHITIPMVSTVTLFNLIIGVIGTFQYFTNAFIVGVSATGGSTTSTGAAAGGTGAPDGALLFYAVYLYNQAFGYLHMGYASAMAWVLLVLILAITLIILRSSSRWTYYEVQSQ